MTNKPKKRTERRKPMKDVVAQRGADASAALDLDVAVAELTLTAQSLAGSASEVARDAGLLADAPPLATPARFRQLAEGARRTSEMAQNQASLLLELKHSLNARSVTPSRPHRESIG